MVTCHRKKILKKKEKVVKFCNVISTEPEIVLIIFAIISDEKDSVALRIGDLFHQEQQHGWNTLQRVRDYTPHVTQYKK